jgi:hypothetical protein
VALLIILTLAIYLIFVIFVARVLSSIPSDARTSGYIALMFILFESLYLWLRGVGLFVAGRKLQRSLRQFRREGSPRQISSETWPGREALTLIRSYPRGLIALYLFLVALAGFTSGIPAMSQIVVMMVEITLEPSRLAKQSLPEILDVLAPALPFLLLLIAFSLAIGGLASALLNIYSQITADERGVTVAGRRRTRQIAWDEIAFFVRLTRSEYPAVAGSYALLGRRKYVIFDVSDAQEAPPANATNRSRANRSNSRFEGGHPQYAKDARRLIERIQCRTGLELRDISSKPLNPEDRAFVALQVLSLEALTQARIANQSPQPTANSRGVQDLVELVTHLPWRVRLRSVLASVV